MNHNFSNHTNLGTDYYETYEHKYLDMLDYQGHQKQRLNQIGKECNWEDIIIEPQSNEEELSVDQKLKNFLSENTEESKNYINYMY